MKTILIMILITLSLCASEEVRKIPNYVIDNKSIKLIDSKKAFFIIGSRKYGTMKENFAFANKEDAQKYVNKNGGAVVDYKTYVNMSDQNIEEYVKKHGVKVEKKEIKKKTDSKPAKANPKKNNSSDIYNEENMKKYKF